MFQTISINDISWNFASIYKIIINIKEKHDKLQYFFYCQKSKYYTSMTRLKTNQ